MNTWVDQLLVELREKAAVLHRQLDGIEDAIIALERGYDQKPIEFPKGAMRRLDTAQKQLDEELAGEGPR